MKRILFYFLAVALMFSCSEDDDSSSPSGNNNNNNSNTPDMIASSLILPSGTEQVSGDLPAAGAPQDAPSMLMADTVFTMGSGGSTSIGGSYGNAKRRLGGASFQVSGASFHYKVPVNIVNMSQDSSSGDFSFQLGLGQGITEDVLINMNIYDSEKSDVYSQPVQIILRPQSNNNNDTTSTDSVPLAINLNWNGPNPQRLTVIDPFGDSLTNDFPTVPSGGAFVSLPIAKNENASWQDAPDGEYYVYVTDTGTDTTTTNGSVLINTDVDVIGGQNPLTFSHSGGERNLISHFRKEGSLLEEL